MRILAILGIIVAMRGLLQAGERISGTMTSRVEMGYMSKDELHKLFKGNPPERTFSWVVFIDGSRWRIKVETKGRLEGESFEVGNDGHTTYSLNILRSVDSTRDDPNKSSKINDSLGVIEDGVMPFEEDLPVHPVWLAFCVPRLLATFPDNTMPLIQKIGVVNKIETRRAKYPIRYEWAHPSKYFSKFELLNDGYIREVLSDGQLLISQREPPHNNGFVQTRLRGDDLMDFSGIPIPVRFVYERLTPTAGTNGIAGVFDKWSLTVESLSITNLEHFSWIPAATGNTQVKDRRYANASPPVLDIEYRLPRRNWPKKDEPFLVKQYESIVGTKVNTFKYERKGSPAVIYSLFALLTITPILVFFYYRRSQRLK